MSSSLILPSPGSLRLLLPREHGAWAFLLLPLAAGLLVAPSGAGLLVAVGALAAFLARGPYQAGRSGLPLLALLAGVGLPLLGLGAWRGGWVTLAALGGAAVLGLPLMGRSMKEMRNLTSEGLALLACGALLPALLGAGGASAGEAFRGWVLLVLLALPPLVHLRHRLAQGRQGEPPRPSKAAVILQFSAAILAFELWRVGYVAGLIPLWTLALFVRGFQSKAVSPRRLGWTEAVVSLGHLGVLWISLSGL